MIHAPARTHFRILWGLVALVLLLLPPLFARQNSPASMQPGPPGSDALPFLMDFLSQYARATTSRLEFTRESRMEGESIKHWSKAVIAAIVGPENRYHFELHGEGGSAVQISDGKTEWCIRLA
jgi:hypothetical protein